MGTQFVVAGILPEIAHDLGIPGADAGLMITVFAIGHVVVATTSNLGLILGARFLVVKERRALGGREQATVDHTSVNAMAS